MQSSELEKMLNKRILDENYNLLRFNNGLSTPQHEKTPTLRQWKACEPENENLGQEVSEREVLLNSRFTVIFGGPGSGKSTYIRRFGRKVLDKKIKHLKEITIVHFINVCELATEGAKTDFLTFFFSNLVHGFDDAQGALKCLKENENKILIIMDGLNDFHRIVMDKQLELINYTDQVKPEIILFNLLHGRLLPGAKILAATRWHGIQKYHKSIEPRQLLILYGFTKADSKYLFEEMTSTTNTDLWEKLSERLKSLCSTPLWLVYVAFIMKEDPKSRMDNISSIMINFLQNFYYKDEWDTYPDIFVNLKRFSLDKMKHSEKRFTESKIKEFGLTKQHIASLCITVPKSVTPVFEEHGHASDVYFSHILIQESLACLGFLDLDLKKFKDVLDEYIKQPAFHTFMQIACGTLLNQNTRRLCDGLISDISHEREKKELLKETLLTCGDCLLNGEDLLHHLKCVQETGLREELSTMLPDVINLDMCVLSLADTHSISAVIAGHQSLKELSLYGCGIDDEKIKVLAGSLAESKSNIKSLILRSNYKIGHKGMQDVARIVEALKVEELDVSHCGISASILDKMMTMKIKSLRTLKLTGYRQGGDDRMKAIEKCIVENNINELHINWSNLKPQELECLASTLEKATVPITSLNISNNKSINSNECVEYLRRIAKLIKQTEMILTLDIHECGFSSQQEGVLKGLKGLKLCRLDEYQQVALDTPEFLKMLQSNRGQLIHVSLTGTSQQGLSDLPAKLQQHGCMFGRLCLPEGKSALKKDVEILVQLIPYIKAELWLGNWLIDQEGRNRLRSAIYSSNSNMEIFYSNDDTTRNPNSHSGTTPVSPPQIRKEKIKKSTKEFYELHNNNKDVYYIDPDRLKGKVLIINNEFEGETRRAGSEVDVSNLKMLWEDLGFDLNVRNKLTAVEMRRQCEEFAMDESPTNIVIVILMSHGGKESKKEFILGEDGNKVFPDEIISYFSATKCPHLHGIPKVFIFQACRGNNRDGDQTDAVDERSGGLERIPALADMVMVYPCQSGCVCFRNDQSGSWLVDILDKVFRLESHNKHIIDMLTKVNREVAEKGQNNLIQGSSNVNHLRKNLYLFPGWP